MLSTKAARLLSLAKINSVLHSTLRMNHEKMWRSSVSVQFLCVIRGFRSAPAVQGRVQMCVFFFTGRRRRRGASEPITAARGRVECELLWIWKNGQFITHIHHSYPKGESFGCTLIWLANAWPWCETEDHQWGGEERGSLPGKGELSVGEKSGRSGDCTG